MRIRVHEILNVPMFQSSHAYHQTVASHGSIHVYSLYTPFLEYFSYLLLLQCIMFFMSTMVTRSLWIFRRPGSSEIFIM